jgi:hypothetical protein
MGTNGWLLDELKAWKDEAGVILADFVDVAWCRALIDLNTTRIVEIWKEGS